MATESNTQTNNRLVTQCSYWKRRIATEVKCNKCVKWYKKRTTSLFRTFDKLRWVENSHTHTATHTINHLYTPIHLYIHKPKRTHTVISEEDQWRA